MITQKDKHEHKFKKTIKAKTQLRDQGGLITGEDIILLHKCKCGAARAYDLTRIKR